MRSRHGIRVGKGVRPDTHIISEEVDRIQESLANALSVEERRAAVKYVLKGNEAKLEIKLPGEPDKTSEMMRMITEAINNYFRAA